MISHIVWDWNGTVFGDSRALINATVDAFAACGLPPVAVALTADAVDAFTRWSSTGGRQSLLSMYPHEQLIPLVEAAGIIHHFTRIDGSSGTDLAHKAPHLRRHLTAQAIPPDRAVIVGDSLDDARAAQACGVRCVLYHPGENALHSRNHFTDTGVPVVASLTAAVQLLLHPDHLPPP